MACAEIIRQPIFRSDSYVCATSVEGGKPHAFNTASQSGFCHEDYIWLELSLVPDVERVFVWSDEDVFRVVTVVDANDPHLRDKIYDRELAIIETLPMHRFDFYVLPRMGNDLAELVDYAKKPAYCRR